MLGGAKCTSHPSNPSSERSSVSPAILALTTFGTGVITDAAEVARRYLAGAEGVGVWSHVGIAVTFVGSMMAFPAFLFWSFTTKNVSVLRRSVIVTIALGCVVYATWVLVLGAAFVIDPALDNPDTAYFTALRGLADNPVVIGLAGAAAFSAIMSSTDGMLIAASSIAARDVWFVMRPGDLEERGLMVGRTASVLLAAAALVFAFYTPAIIGELTAAAAASAGSAFVFPLVLGVWWKRMNVTGALLGMFGGYATFMGLTFLAELPPNVPVLIAIPVSALLCVVGSLVSAPPEEARLRFVDSLHDERREPVEGTAG